MIRYVAHGQALPDNLSLANRLMNDQNHPGMNQKSGRVSNKLGHFSKTDVRFWQDHLFRETYRNKGRLCQTSHWSARIQHEGCWKRFPLYTPNRAAAAARARDIYFFLVATGWEAVLARYRKPKTIVHDPDSEQPVTVGSFLNACSASARTGPRSKGTQLRSGKSSPISSGLPLTRQNSISIWWPEPMAGKGPWCGTEQDHR
jgi:hypothetical protein